MKWKPMLEEIRRYRVTATLVWDAKDTAANLRQQIDKDLDLFFTGKQALRRDFRLERLKKTDYMPIKIGEFKIEDVLPFIRNNKTKRDYQVDGVTYAARMDSARYFIFRESLACAACGLVGSKMFLEKDTVNGYPHFNLYAEEDGKLIMFTKDHIHPKSYGGANRHSNYQTMCSICNGLKGDTNLTLLAIKELRDIYNKNCYESKKDLRKILADSRSRLARQEYEYKSKKYSESDLFCRIDIAIWKLSAGNLLGRRLSASPLDGAIQVGCIRAGTSLTPVHLEKKFVTVRVADVDFKIAQDILGVAGTSVVLGG